MNKLIALAGQIRAMLSKVNVRSIDDAVKTFEETNDGGELDLVIGRLMIRMDLQKSLGIPALIAQTTEIAHANEAVINSNVARLTRLVASLSETLVGLLGVKDCEVTISKTNQAIINHTVGADLERLLHDMRRSNSNLASIERQISTLNSEIETAQEELEEAISATQGGDDDEE